mgnify:CR=1 FL=1
MKKLVIGGVAATLFIVGLAALIWHYFIYRDPALWKVDLHQPYDGWDLFCDQYEGTEERRCYLRYVDTYSLDPFGAAVFFVQHDVEGGSQLEISLEKNNSVVSSSFVVAGETRKTRLFSGCTSNVCTLDAEQTGQFMMSASDAELWLLKIKEADKEERLLELDVAKFSLAELNFVTELKKRGLY